MTIVLRLAFAAVALSVAPGQGSAASVTGNALHDWCNTAMAIPYVIGAKETAALTAPEPGYFCIPRGVTNGQIKDVVCKWLEDNPAERNKPAAYLTITALRQTWACE